MKRSLLVSLLLVCISISAHSQYSKGQMKEDFYSAESFILYEEYKDALPLYQGLLRIDPTNANYRYRIGQCLINIDGRKQEAASFLEVAAKKVNPKYKEGKFKETGAPFDVYYYLANAYRINNQLDKAIDTYELFKDNLDAKVYDTAVVNQQIESCRNAKELMKVPLYVKKTNLGNVINSQYSDVNPVISGDQNVMVYNRLTPFQEALLFTRKVNGAWTEPRNIIPDLGLGQESGNYATSLSFDGKELYVYRRGEDYDGNIYVTKRISEDKWSNLIKLNENINTKYWESHATVSHDGKHLYFTSNRKDSYGGLDIYVSERDSSDAWKPAKNLGPTINSVYNEESPFLGKDDKTLFFSSRGHYNIGGYDIFYSTLQSNGQWTLPLNIGYPINTTDEDVFFNPINDGYQAYYSLIDSSGFGGSDIYTVEIFSKDHPRKFFVRGMVQVKDLLSIFKDSVKVSTLNLEDPNKSVVVYTNPSTGEYKFEVPQGKYSITFEANGAQLTTRKFDIPLNNPSDSFVLPGTSLPKTDLYADLDIGNKKDISVVKGDSISIPIKAEKNSILEVEHWVGDKLVSTEKFILTDSNFVYKTAPKDGKNRYVFKLTDKYSNTNTSEITVTKKKIITSQTVVRPEYSSVIAKKQIDAFVELLKKRSDGDLRTVIIKTKFNKQKFAKVDDVLTFLKGEAAKHKIEPVEVDKLATRVGLMDNVLTQAAVNLLAANSDCKFREILKDVNIYDLKLKTWVDLQNYISEKSGGTISPEDVNRITADILEGRDPFLFTLKHKIDVYTANSDKANILNSSVSVTNTKGIMQSGQWLRALVNELNTGKLTLSDIAVMLSAVSSVPNTAAEAYIADITGFADQEFSAYLRGTDLQKNKLKSSYDVLLYLLKNEKTSQYNPDYLYNALARLITCKEVPDSLIKPQPIPVEKTNLTVLWFILGAALIFFFIIFLFRRRKKDKQK
jgi:tetratricopeptide (TPR) repeat protein